ncbi:hypothetical protein BDF14DRAFT_1835266 [Spinellus fusiger]|nr:hypothetical protein BDF14DRAFT_1835266 [Spinellus fusiger]
MTAMLLSIPESLTEKCKGPSEIDCSLYSSFDEPQSCLSRQLSTNIEHGPGHISLDSSPSEDSEIVPFSRRELYNLSTPWIGRHASITNLSIIQASPDLAPVDIEAQRLQENCGVMTRNTEDLPRAVHYEYSNVYQGDFSQHSCSVSVMENPESHGDAFHVSDITSVHKNVQLKIYSVKEEWDSYDRLDKVEKQYPLISNTSRDSISTLNVYIENTIVHDPNALKNDTQISLPSTIVAEITNPSQPLLLPNTKRLATRWIMVIFMVSFGCFIGLTFTVIILKKVLSSAESNSLQTTEQSSVSLTLNSSINPIPVHIQSHAPIMAYEITKSISRNLP